ncbi:di-trans,poly-cis-decaprenylcistransferase [Candidatus Saccharibacteria bacterium]|nr:di-trans,poly-cis-decaprenylcistransferase [Candidatus Saccharibacteria bacterium]
MEHLGFIVDGNRRWARERGLPTLEGHRRGFDKVEKIASETISRGVEFVSFYLFSTENWGRSDEEVAYLMDLVRKNVEKMGKKFKKEGIRCVIMGRKEPAPDDVWKSLMELEEDTKGGDKGTVCICFNYGGHWEIADAMTKILAKRASDENYSADLAEITPEIIAENLYHPEVPPCDLIVRTSGEERLSGFQLWRAAYSEFLFLDKYFPDMETADLDDIFAEYNRRQRRFGK